MPRHPKELGLTNLNTTATEIAQVLPLRQIVAALSGQGIETNIRAIDTLSDKELTDRLAQLLLARNFANGLLGFSTAKIQETKTAINATIKDRLFGLQPIPVSQIPARLSQDIITSNHTSERVANLPELAVLLSVINDLATVEQVTLAVLQQIHSELETPLRQIWQRKKNNFNLSNYHGFEAMDGAQQSPLIDEYVLATDQLPEKQRTRIELNIADPHNMVIEGGRVRFNLAPNPKLDPAYDADRLLLAIEMSQPIPGGQISLRYPHVDESGNITSVTALIIRLEERNDIRTVACWAKHHSTPLRPYDAAFKPQGHDYNLMTRRLAVITDYAALFRLTEVEQALQPIRQDWGLVFDGAFQGGRNPAKSLEAYHRMWQGLDALEQKYFPR